jgi:3-deoxy-7-phosphoheptulonate synthase
MPVAHDNPFSFRRTYGPALAIPSVLATRFERHEGLVVIGGPCAVESQEQVDRIVPAIAADVTFFRGGVFRAGTYPPKEFGLKMDLLKYYHGKTMAAGKPNIVDILDYRQIEQVEPYAGAFQVGMRAAQNYTLLMELSKQRKPVFLKRGSWQRLDEWLGSLEYFAREGKRNVRLIERGIVGFDNHTRYSLCLASIPAIKSICDVPIIVDACHGTGRRDIVPQMTYAGVACGSDGILLETHYDPEKSLSDADQTIDLNTFHETVSKAKQLYQIVQRTGR